MAKAPFTIFGGWFALSVWIQAFYGIASPLTGGNSSERFGAFSRLFGPGYGGQTVTFLDHAGLFVSGAVALFIAPWTMRLVVYLDRRMMQLLLGPSAAATRVKTLEESRSKTLDAATETLRRIERNLHDGTQAQLVALAMRLGQAKDKLDHLGSGEGPDADLNAVRRLVDEAHRGAKEAITDLRDLARGIHRPPSTRASKRAHHPGRPQPRSHRSLGVHPDQAQPGHRGHLLLLCGRTAGQRGSACAGFPCLAQLHSARPVAKARGARRRPGRCRRQPGGLVIQRPGRPGRSSARR